MNPILNYDEQTVQVGEKCEHLTPKEYDILELLMNHPGKTFTSEEIYETIWQWEPFACRQVIAVHLRHIREKIEEDPSHPKFIKSLWGRGYRFVQS